MGMNVYEDLGFEDAEDMLVKADLTVQIQQIMTERHLTQKAVSGLTGIPQSRVSNILKGHFRDVSIERLVFAVRALGRNVQITITEPDGAGDGPGKLTVAGSHV